MLDYPALFMVLSRYDINRNPSVIPETFWEEGTKSRFLESSQDISPLNKFRCMSSDKKQLYLLILWISFAAWILLLALEFFVLISQSTVSRWLLPKKNTTETFCTQCHHVGVNYGARNFRFWFFMFWMREQKKWKEKLRVHWNPKSSLASPKNARVSAWHKKNGWKVNSSIKRSWQLNMARTCRDIKIDYKNNM